MSFIGRILGSATGGAVKGLMDGAGSLAIKLRSAITGEMSAADRAKLEALAVEAEGIKAQGQLEINRMEATHKSIFVAGWRPFIGWVCGVALAWNFVLYPMVLWYMSIWRPLLEPPPSLDLNQLYPIIVGILGLGAFRSYEKARGAQKNH